MVLTSQAFNGPALEVREPEYRMVRCRVLRPMYVRGQRAAVGDVVELPEHEARDLVAVGKAEAIR